MMTTLHRHGRYSGHMGSSAEVVPAGDLPISAQCSDDINSYTLIANLAMIPECFAGLTDKNGPLTCYLRWHAWTVYGWKPSQVEAPQMPIDYSNIRWRYMSKIDAPTTFIRERFDKLNSERIRILRSLGAAQRWKSSEQ
jgi:hypothetical protein